MKEIVVFASKTGFTEHYAKLIANSLGIEAVSLDDIKVKSLSTYDTVIFGGWIMGSNIMGLMKIRKNVTGKLFLFGVGASKMSDENTELIIKQNDISSFPFFYMPGGLKRDKLCFLKRKMIDMVANEEDKKQKDSEQPSLKTSFDISDDKYIEPLIKAVKETASAK